MATTNRQIMKIGAMGGLSLGVLKLIDSGFYLDNITGTTAIAAYLTYIAYVFLGMVVANFFVERSLADDKIKKNAFMLGLLAPSLLLALSNKPNMEEAGAALPVDGIPTLGALIIPEANAAECAKGTVTAKDGSCVRGKELSKGDLEPAFKDALLSAVGLGKYKKSYSFVVGKTDDPKVAARIVDSLNTAYAGAGVDDARILKPKKIDIYYITIGDPSDQKSTRKAESAVKKKAILGLRNADAEAFQKAYEIVLGGKVTNTSTLLNPKLASY